MIEAKKIIEARKMLFLIDAICFQNAEKNERRKFHKELYRQAFPEKFKKENSVSLDEAFKRISSIL